MPDLVNLGRSGLRVSRLALGTYNFGNLPSGCDEETSLAILDAYLGLGFNYVDTANIYGGSLAETYVGKALKGRRDAVVLATKAGGLTGPGPFDGGTSRKALYRALEDSLRRLQTDYIDLYQLHIFDHHTPLEETLATLNDFVRQGKVRHLGISNWTAAQTTDAVRILEARGWEPIIASQLQYSLLQREIEAEIVPCCRHFGIGILAWSPLAGGLLGGIYRQDQEPPPDSRLATFPGMRSRLTQRTWDAVETVRRLAADLGTTPARLSLAWLLRRPGVVAPIVGPQTVEQLLDCLGALDLTLTEDVSEQLDALAPPSPPPYPHNFGRRS